MTTHPQAAFLHALADHLDLHPDLHPVTVHQGRTPVNLQIGGDESSQNLADWARSVGAEHLEVRYVLERTVHLHAHGHIADHAVDVWDSVYGFDTTDIEYGSVIALERLDEVPA